MRGIDASECDGKGSGDIRADSFTAKWVCTAPGLITARLAPEAA
jgi:hypothetical protein